MQHGTRGGYIYEVKRHLPVCKACREANRDWRREQYLTNVVAPKLREKGWPEWQIELELDARREKRMNKLARSST